VVSSLLWCNLSNPFVWMTLGVTVCYAVIGFVDDYLKLKRRESTYDCVDVTRFVHPLALPATRMRGSTTAIARSARRLPTTTRKAESSVVARTIG